MIARFRTPGFSLTQRVRHALSDLASRPGTTALNATSVSVAVLCLLVFGYLGLSLYRYRHAVLAEQPLERVTVMAKDATDPHQRLTTARIAALAAGGDVARAFPKVEVGGRVWRDPDAPATATAEGTVAGDPVVAPARLAWGRPPESGAEAVVPESLFRKLGGRVTARGPADDRLTLEVRRTTGGRDESHPVGLRVVGLSRGTDEKLYVPLPLAVALDQWCTHAIEQMPGADGRVQRPRFTPTSVIAFGPAAHADRVKRDTEHLGATARKVGEFRVPESAADVWLAVQCDDPAAVTARLAGRVESLPFTHTAVRAVEGEFRLVALDRGDPRWAGAGVWPRDGEVYTAARAKARALLGTAVRVAESATIAFPQADAYCTPATLLRVTLVEFATVSATSASGFGFPVAVSPPEPRVEAAFAQELSLRVAPLHLAAVTRELTAAGAKFCTVTPVGEAVVAAYELKPGPDAPDGGAHLLAAARAGRPTFTEAVPLIRVAATRGRTELTLHATNANDPRRFAAVALRGSWPAESGFDITLPAATVAELFPNEPPATCAGRELTLAFERDHRNEFDRTLAIPVRLAAVTAGGSDRPAFVSESLAEGVSLWAAGKVDYSPNRKVFEPPAARYERAGFARCNLDAADPERVAGVVARLQAEGYPVSHRLAELQGQQKLGRMLVVVVAVLAGLYLLSGTITVFSSNAQQVAGKVYEIGVLRSLGMGRREVVGLFALQGLITGLAAFALGTVAALILEPSVTRTLTSTCGVPAEVLPTRLADVAHLPLIGAALVVAVLASTFGAVVPAIRAARLDLVDSMRRVG